MTTKLDQPSRRERGLRLDARDGDILAGLLVLAFSAVIYLHVSDLPTGAASFPSGIAIVLAASGLFLILRSLRVPKTGKFIADGYSWGLFAVTVALWGATVVLIQLIDFFMVAPLFLACMSWIMSGAERSVWSLLRSLAFGVVLSGGMWVVFVFVLRVALP